MTIKTAYTKQPAEQETVKIDWSKRAASLVVSGYAISSVQVKIYDSTGTEKTADMLDGAASFVGTDIYATIKAGEDGKNYDARIRVTLQKALNPDQVQEEDLTILVREVTIAT